MTQALRVAPPEVSTSSPGTPLGTPEDLIDAFQRFSSASERLEQKYETLRRESEDLKARLRQKDDEIRRGARLAMLGETAAALAHEVRNPLGALRLFVSLLKSDVADRPQSAEIVAHMERTMASLNHVVENILHFAKDGTGVMSPVHLHAILQEQANTLTSDPRGEITIEFKLEGNPFIRGNEHSLRHVFANVLLNAAQSMRWQGIIVVRSYPLRDDRVAVEILDEGQGIAPSIADKLFEPFATGKNEGTGLGLSVAKKMLDQHGATISLRNRAEPEQGAIARIVFERSGPRPSAAANEEKVS